MLLTNVDGVAYVITWKYDYIPITRRKGNKVTPITCRRVLCSLQSSETPERIHYASAICSPKDRFSKEAGKKIALARVLNEIPRNKRINFWRDYVAQTKQNWQVAKG
jgi:hypothetical protein